MGFMLFQQLEFFFNLILLGIAALVMVFGYVHTVLETSGSFVNMIIQFFKSLFQKENTPQTEFNLDEFKSSASHFFGLFFLLMTLSKFAFYLASTFCLGFLKKICPCCYEKEIKTSPKDGENSKKFLENERGGYEFEYDEDIEVIGHYGKPSCTNEVQYLNYDYVEARLAIKPQKPKSSRTRKTSKDLVEYCELDEVDKTGKIRISLSDDETKGRRSKKKNLLERSATDVQKYKEKAVKFKKGQSLEDDYSSERKKSKKKLKNRAMSADELETEDVSVTDGPAYEKKAVKFEKGKSLDNDGQLEYKKSKKKKKDRAMSADELETEDVTDGPAHEEKAVKCKKGKSLDDDSQLEYKKSKKKQKDRAMSADELYPERVSKKKSKNKENSLENSDDDGEIRKKKKRSGSKKLKRANAVEDESSEKEEKQEDQVPEVAPVPPNSNDTIGKQKNQSSDVAPDVIPNPPVDPRNSTNYFYVVE